ncbi:PASTA domain-containing protein [Paractinoplanes toevensis]|uniref:PASTA domain-containing protein n=1 Tax=Paractinoplanes toevensis TaxID=571911 RepID=UPI001BB33F7E|nr:PASTA domain-containing protein [Actinoplanes toevensis]
MTTPSVAGASAEEATSTVTTQAPKAAKIKVPPGVGLDYQSAQDLWRSAGLHVAPAEDATGANRIPVIDSNWVVVSQDPKAGSMVEAGSFITATVKKDSDD